MLKIRLLVELDWMGYRYPAGSILDVPTMDAVILIGTGKAELVPHQETAVIAAPERR